MLILDNLKTENKIPEKTNKFLQVPSPQNRFINYFYNKKIIHFFPAGKRCWTSMIFNFVVKSSSFFRPGQVEIKKVSKLGLVFLSQFPAELGSNLLFCRPVSYSIEPVTCCVEEVIFLFSK